MSQQSNCIKTLEFKLSLNASQSAAVDAWLDVQRWVWNQGLAYLEEFEAFSHYNRHDKAQAPCCPLPWEYRWQKGDDDDWVAIPFSRVRRHERSGFSCPVPQFYRKPRLERDSEYSITPLFAHKLNQDKPWFISCPYKITQCTIQSLDTAWQEYKKGKRRAPRFKPRKGKCAVKTISDSQAGGARVDRGRVRVPRLGWLSVRSLSSRWPVGVVVKTWRIKKEPSGYYLLLVGDMPCEAVKPSKKIAGYDAGLAHTLTDDTGRHIDVPSSLRRRLKKIKRLSRQASRRSRGSKNQLKTYANLAKTYEKVRRDRKAWRHKLSTFAVRKYEGIAVEDLDLVSMTKSPKAKPNAQGTGYNRNMSTAKSGLNRALLDAGFGGLFTMMEIKAKVSGRRFVRVQPQFTSQTCNACGVVDKNSRLSQSKFVCTGCGHTANADANAARNIRDTAFPEYRGNYPALAGDVKPVELARVSTMKQEVEQSTPQGDALAIPFEESRRVSAPYRKQKLSSRNPKKRKADCSVTVKQLTLWDDKYFQGD